MAEYKHIWGQGIIDYRNKDLAALKMRKCLESINVYYPEKQGEVLEIGCGAGRFIRSLKAHLPHFHYSGCDIDAGSIRLAASYDDGISYQVADAVSLPYTDRMFDVIVLFDILEHVENTGHFMKEILKITRQGTLLHTYVPCEGEPHTLYWFLNKLKIGHNLTRKHAGHINRFTKKEIIELFKAYNFKVLDISYSTYLLGQFIDLTYYAMQEIGLIRETLLTAHAAKDVDEEQSPFISRLFKKIINKAFHISYLESVSCKNGKLAQGLHLTCIRR